MKAALGPAHSTRQTLQCPALQGHTATPQGLCILGAPHGVHPEGSTQVHTQGLPIMSSHTQVPSGDQGVGCHSLVMPSARMSDILQQDDKMRMLGWSMMSTCPDGRRDGRWADRWAREAEAAPEVRLGW